MNNNNFDSVNAVRNRHSEIQGARARSPGEPSAVHDVTRCRREDGSVCGRVVYRHSIERYIA